mmetsp:Transcript_31718/g.75642  ORF Transcript_31718/g.75642 Transcript_31718/m.75642 type:complete len:281 (+) Transcript_31718:1325-2167(+)
MLHLLSKPLHLSTQQVALILPGPTFIVQSVDLVTHGVNLGIQLRHLGLGLLQALLRSPDGLRQAEADKAPGVLEAPGDHPLAADPVPIQRDGVNAVPLRHLFTQLHVQAHHCLPEDLLHCWPCPGRAPDHVHQGLDALHGWKLMLFQRQLTQGCHHHGAQAPCPHVLHRLRCSVVIHGQDVEEGVACEALHSSAEGRSHLEVGQEGAPDAIMKALLLCPAQHRRDRLAVGSWLGPFQAVSMGADLLPDFVDLPHCAVAVLAQQPQLFRASIQLVTQATHH